MRYMLDTNICIYLMRRHPPEVVARFAGLAYGDVVMSSITLAELRFGALVSPQREREDIALAGLLEDVPALPFENSAAASYAMVRAALPDRRRDALDRLIAAHAIAAGCVLVTNNEADFRGYPDLAVENWAPTSQGTHNPPREARQTAAGAGPERAHWRKVRTAQGSAGANGSPPRGEDQSNRDESARGNPGRVKRAISARSNTK